MLTTGDVSWLSSLLTPFSLSSPDCLAVGVIAVLTVVLTEDVDDDDDGDDGDDDDDDDGGGGGATLTAC